MKAQWVKYDGSEKQIAEIFSANHGVIVKNKSGDIFEPSVVSRNSKSVLREDFTEYLICSPHPLADMICQYARTGQPVWVKEGKSHARPFIYETNTPDWNIPGAEYSFTPFEEEV